MSEQITRQLMTIPSLSLTTALGTTPEIPYEEFSQGSIAIPTGSSITTLTWFGAVRQSDQPGTSAEQMPATQTFLAAQDSTGTPVTQTVSAAKSYPIPVALAGFAALKCVVNAAGTVDLSLKS